MFLGLIAAFYVLVCNVLGRNVAFLATAAFATYSQFHTVTSFEWNYQVHDGALNVLLAMYCLERATRKDANTPAWLLWGGAFWAQGLQTVYMAAFIPAMVIWFLWLNHENSRRPILTSAGWIVAGGILVTLAYGAVNRFLGGPFFFFAGILDPFNRIVLGTGSHRFAFHPGYWAPLSEIFRSAKGFALPFVTFAATSLLLVHLFVARRKGPYLTSISLCLVVSLAAAGGALFMHLIGHGQFSRDNISAYQAPFVFLGVAALFAYMLRVAGLTVPANAKFAWVTKVLVYLAMLSGLTFGEFVNRKLLHYMSIAKATAGMNDGAFYTMDALLIASIGSVAIAAVSIGLALAPKLITYKYIANTIIFALVLSSINNRTASINVSSYDVFNKCGYYKYQYMAVSEIFQLFLRYKFGYSWYRSNDDAPNPNKDCASDPVGSTIRYGALYGATLGLYGYSLIPGTKPETFLVEPYLSTMTFERLALERPYIWPKTFRLAVLYRDAKDGETARATLARYGFRTEILAQERIEYPPVRIDVTVLDVTKDDRLRDENILHFQP